MDENIIERLEQYASAVNKAPGTVCREATGNFRLYERLKKWRGKIATEAERLHKYMEDNPPKREAAE